MVGIQPNTTVIGRLRIRSMSSDPQAEQQRISRMLRSSTLHPSGLPESAMLVVRRLADPLPSRLRAGPRDLLPDPSWQRAVADALEKLAGSAARPAYGAVPADTNAVLFYDRAEVLASLARDWMSGTLPVQWWWRELLRGRDAITALLREWIEAPQYVPAAVELLAQRNDVVKFAQRLPRQAVVEMLDAVADSHGLPRPSAASSEPRLTPAGSAERAEPMTRSSKTQLQGRLMALSALLSRWAPEAINPGLAPPQKMLLIQALMLRRAPSLVRTAGFQAELLRWEAASDRVGEFEVLDDAGDHPSLPREVSRERLPGTVSPKQEEAAHKLETLRPSDRGDDEKPISPQLAGAESHTEIQNGNIHKAKRHRFTSGPQAATDNTEEDRRVNEVFSAQDTGDTEIVPEPPLVAEPGPVQKPQAEPTSEPAITFETEYGGVFFLLGLSLYLYIYGDFTSPAKPGLELNIWDFLSLMGSELTSRAVEKDPIWDQLASLAARPKLTRPGLDFDPPDRWRVPAEWLDPFQETYDAQPILSEGRSIVKHPAGFIVLDVPAGIDISGREEELSRVDRLERWVKWMAAYFRARLVRALGRDDAVTLVCGRPATVVLTLTHVDVSFSLEHHPIELRMAGLDRDLGWIPAAGRYVAFHFR